jgi:hypothetical protein
MDNILNRLSESIELNNVYLQAKLEATRRTMGQGSASATRLVLTSQLYRESIERLSQGIGHPGTVAIVRQMQGINSEKKRIGCP